MAFHDCVILLKGMKSILVPGTDAFLIYTRKGQSSILCFGKSVIEWDRLRGTY